MTLLKELIEGTGTARVFGRLVKNFPPNRKSGGEQIYVITANEISRYVMFSFDFGGTLGAVEIVNKQGKLVDEDLEAVFGEEVYDRLWDGDFDGQDFTYDGM